MQNIRCFSLTAALRQVRGTPRGGLYRGLRRRNFSIELTPSVVKLSPVRGIYPHQCCDGRTQWLPSHGSTRIIHRPLKMEHEGDTTRMFGRKGSTRYLSREARTVLAQALSHGRSGPSGYNHNAA
jgi:hypothetical protein